MARRNLYCLLLTVIGAGASNVALQRPPVFQLAFVDRTGTIERLGMLPAGTFAPRLSPDGRQVAFDTFDGMIWIADLSNVDAPRRFGAGRFPMWSADGSRLLFTGADGMRLYWQAADGSGTPELLTEDARAPESWSATARLVTYITLKQGNDYDIWAFSPEERRMRPLVSLPTSAEMSSRFSPDGTWLAYESNDSGTFEVFVEPFPRTGERTRVSTAGGQRPVWSPDGREIVYDHGGTLYSARFESGPDVRVGTATALPVEGFVQAAGRRLWDMTPDGERFLVMLPK